MTVKTVYRFFKKVGLLGYSRKKNILGMNPLIVSTSFLILTAVIANTLRKVIRSTLEDGLVKQLCMEFIATAELCACCFELAVIADNFGVWVYAAYLFFLSIWWSKTWDNASACPYTQMEGIIEGSQKISHAILIILAQLLGGFVIFRYVQILWSFELVEIHKGRATAECTADLQVSVALGAFIECFATFVYRLIVKFLSQADGRMVPIVISLIGVSIVLVAMDYTGGYMNPGLATMVKYGCKGMTKTEHIMVYWVGASLGAILASLVLMLFGVPMMFGAFVEGIATCVCRITSRFLGDTEARFGSIVDPFFATMMVVAAFNFSGGYFNPALATSLKWGCDGQTLLEFMIVYWLGACAGAVASVFVYNMSPMKNLLARIKQKKE